MGPSVLDVWRCSCLSRVARDDVVRPPVRLFSSASLSLRAWYVVFCSSDGAMEKLLEMHVGEKRIRIDRDAFINNGISHNLFCSVRFVAVDEGGCRWMAERTAPR